MKIIHIIYSETYSMVAHISWVAGKLNGTIFINYFSGAWETINSQWRINNNVFFKKSEMVVEYVLVHMSFCECFRSESSAWLT